MTWDPLQREVLEAMGYRIYRVDGAGGEPATFGGEALPERLWQALLRAAGLADRPGSAEALSAQLQGAAPASPAAKRALWPRLRALRAPGGDA